MNYLKLKLDSKSRPLITEFSGYHCKLFEITATVTFYIITMKTKFLLKF